MMCADKQHPLLTLFALIAVVCACNNRTSSRLEQIDSLLSKDQVEKAYAMVQAIPAHEMDNSDEMAYFTLLKTEATYRNMISIDNDSIDISVFYYEQHGPKEQLARAYYYKACILFFNRNNVTAGHNATYRPSPGTNRSSPDHVGELPGGETRPARRALWAH